MEKLLLHACCAPCAVMPYTHLKDEYSIVMYFYNPNIHPEEEYNKRHETFQRFVEQEKIPYAAEMLHEEGKISFEGEGYQGMEAWAKNMPTLKFPDRCKYCYEPRLRQTAIKAKSLNIGVFSTSLLYSRYQQHDVIIEQGHAIAKEYGLEFLDRDFRPYWYDGIKMSKEMNMYRQKYCGCGLPEK